MEHVFRVMRPWTSDIILGLQASAPETCVAAQYLWASGSLQICNPPKHTSLQRSELGRTLPCTLQEPIVQPDQASDPSATAHWLCIGRGLEESTSIGIFMISGRSQTSCWPARHEGPMESGNPAISHIRTPLWATIEPQRSRKIRLHLERAFVSASQAFFDLSNLCLMCLILSTSCPCSPCLLVRHLGTPLVNVETDLCTWRVRNDLRKKQTSPDWWVAVLISKGTIETCLGPRQVDFHTCPSET